MNKYGIPLSSIMITGSSGLTYIGGRPNHDIDMTFKPGTRLPFVLKVRWLFFGRIKFNANVEALSQRYAVAGLDNDALFENDNFNQCGALKVIAPEVILAKKINMFREKDKEDIVNAFLDSDIRKRINWDRVAELSNHEPSSLEGIKINIRNKLWSLTNRLFKSSGCFVDEDK